MKKNKIETLGLMIDMSRNAVMNIPALKNYLRLMKKMGYNMLMLYTEDTYEVEGEPYLGYMRGRYSMEELKELDEFAASLGIELIPCVQTLAHFDTFVHWAQVPVDSGPVLMVGEERTYEFIDHILASLRKCFRTNRIHIGMDEAWALGRGKYMDKNGYVPSWKIISEHLRKVNELVKKYNFEPLIWSDMFFRINSPDHKYYIEKTKMPDEIISALPEDVIPVYWDYYHTKEEEYDNMFYNHEQLSDKTWFAGGIWTWRGFLPCNNYTISAMVPALNQCEKHGVKNIMFTLWGDDGGECSRFSTLAPAFYLAQYARGNRDENSIKAKFKKMFGVEFDAFLDFDGVNTAFRGYNDHEANPKQAMFMDYFNGFLDSELLPDYTERARCTAEKLRATAKATRKYGYLFDSAAKLCDVLEVKAALGIKTRAAYQAADKDELRRLANEDYSEILRRLKLFEKAFKKQWFAENKSAGYDEQERRLGGLMLRTASCRSRLIDYADGKIDRIEELECKVLENPPHLIRSYGLVSSLGRR